MTAYILRRLATGVLVLAVVMTGLFFLMQLSPIDASAFYIKPDFPVHIQEQIRQNLGLDKSAIEQFFRWLGRVLQFDFQMSLTRQRPVAEMILEVLPNTLMLASVAIVLIFTFGVLIGIVQSVRQYTATDFMLTLGSLFLYSMPAFWLALMLAMIVSAATDGQWPIEGKWSYTIQLKESAIASALAAGREPRVSIGFFERALDLLQHLALPALALGIPSAAGIARYMRSSMLDVVRQDFVRTARAKGLPARVVLFRHALRNALIPIITLLGLYLPFLISGAVLVENVFAWPGMGRLIVTSIFTYDYPVIMAAAMLLTTLVIAGNLLADVLYSVVDPRIRYG